MTQKAIDNARRTLAKAKDAGAQQLAEDEFLKAEFALENALDHIQRRNNIRARMFAARAEELARIALRKALQMKNETGKATI